MKKKLIFIAYAFYPNKEVAANRIRFWVSYLENFYPDIQPVVVTATPFSEEEKLVQSQFYVPEKKPSTLSVLIKDQGINWRKPLGKFFNSTFFENTMGIVLTGGPFMHFSIIPLLKKKYDCKIAIDFRDPFSDNQRFQNSQFKVRFKRYFEMKFVRNADFVISVNEDYHHTLAGYRDNKSKFHVIPNGFDEESIDFSRQSLTDDKKKGNEIELILTGKYYDNASPLNTFEAIKEIRQEGVPYTFVHYGSWEKEYLHVEEQTYIEEKGIVDYTEVAAALVKSDIGVLISPGIDQNTPTKVFDYIGAELPILIITNGALRAGNVHNVTRNYPLVKWCKNEVKDIKNALAELAQTNLKISYPDRKNYSRRNGLDSLIKILER